MECIGGLGKNSSYGNKSRAGFPRHRVIKDVHLNSGRAYLRAIKHVQELPFSAIAVNHAHTCRPTGRKVMSQDDADI